MKNGIFVTNNGGDVIVLANRTYIDVNAEILSEYLNSESIDFEEWSGPGTNKWEGEEIEEFAKSLGDIVSYFQEGELVIVNENLLNDRKTFHLGE